LAGNTRTNKQYTWSVKWLHEWEIEKVEKAVAKRKRRDKREEKERKAKKKKKPDYDAVQKDVMKRFDKTLKRLAK
jgi:hypothetical protein